jgi:hypothetical protein
MNKGRVLATIVACQIGLPHPPWYPRPSGQRLLGAVMTGCTSRRSFPWSAGLRWLLPRRLEIRRRLLTLPPAPWIEKAPFYET